RTARRGTRRPPSRKLDRVHSGHESRSHCFDVSLYAGDLSCKKNARQRTHLQRLGQDRGRANECVPMNLAKADELGLFESRDQAQDAFLFAELEMVLKTDQVIAVGQQVLLPELNNGERLSAG